MAARAPLRLLLALALLAPACQLLIGGIDDEPGASRPAADGGGEASTDPCVLAAPPGPPAVTAAGGEGSRLYFAARRARFAPDGVLLGYDLDGVCTGLAGSARSGGSCLGDAAADRDGGIDNAFAGVIGRIPFADSDDAGDRAAGTLNANIRRGTQGLLFFLGDYNGQANDDEISIGILTSTGVESIGCDGGASDASTTPLFEGCDNWSYPDPDEVRDKVPVRLFYGHVNDYRLVATPSTVHTVSVAAGEVRLDILEPIVTARIVDDGDGGTALAGGIIAGRINASALLRGVGSLLADGTPVCRSQALFGIFRPAVCEARDMASSPGAPTSARCDAISIALGFDAVKANLGGLRAPPASDDCADADTTCP